MRFAIRQLAVALGAALVLTVCVNAVRADEPDIQAYYDGDIVEVVPLPINASDYGGEETIDGIAIPIYLIDGQFKLNGGHEPVGDHVLSAIPGDDGYSPFWAAYVVENSNATPIKSVDDIFESDGVTPKPGIKVSTTPIGYFLCPEVDD